MYSRGSTSGRGPVLLLADPGHAETYWAAISKQLGRDDALNHTEMLALTVLWVNLPSDRLASLKGLGDGSDTQVAAGARELLRMAEPFVPGPE